MKAIILVLSLSCIFRLQVYAQGVPCRSESRVDLVQQQYGLSGKGVLTIIMDRGVDYRHPDFIDNNGKTRIVWIYDLYDNTGAHDPDNPYGVGTIYDSNEINASLKKGGEPISNDIYGHGTATTGIFAGNGTGATPSDKFRGVAHQSKIICIIMTKDYVPAFGNNPGQNPQYDPSLFKYAFQFASQKIAELRMPSVTLLNIGSVGDPTDGSTEFCTMVENYVANGNTFVCGVGDDGGKDNHMIAALKQNTTTEFIIKKGEAGNLRFSGWYSENDRLEVKIQRPDGKIEGPFASPGGPTDTKDNFLNGINIYHRGSATEFSNSSADIRLLLVDIFGETGTYKIILTPKTIHAGSIINAFLNPARFNNQNAFINNNNPGGSINSFSSCLSTLSPGDYVATNTWTDVNGVKRTKSNEGLPGQLWKGSSTGPTMDGRLGIDFVAPGELAWAAYGKDSYYSSFAFNQLEGSKGAYGLQSAVSAAAPLTAGVIALMLEANPKLTPVKIKEILQQTARKDNYTGNNLPDNKWGYGKLDALAAINAAYALVSTDDTFNNTKNSRIYPNPAHDYIQLTDTDLLQQANTVEIYSATGQKMGDYTISSDGRVEIYDLPGGIYIVLLTTTEGKVPKMLYKY